MTGQEPGRCECSHPGRDHEGGHGACARPGCGCTRYRRTALAVGPPPPAVVAGTVERALVYGGQPDDDGRKVCIGCEKPQGEPHEPWCPAVTGTLSSLRDRPARDDGQ